jgi:hypothetical protein
VTGISWLAHPAMAYGAGALGLGLVVRMFCALKREMRTLALWEAQSEQDAAEAVESVRNEVSVLRAELELLGRETGVLVPPQPRPSGINLSTRSQALRLHRRGDTPESIAATLRIPRREVDLLLKVHRIVVGSL